MAWPRISGPLFMTHASHQSYVEDKLSFWSPIWRPLKMSPPKGQKLHHDTPVQSFTPIGATSAEISPDSIILASCKPGQKPGRKQVESQLRTCLKRVFSTFHLSSTCTKQRTCCGFRQKKVESVSQTCTTLSKSWLQTWSKTRSASRFAADSNNGIWPISVPPWTDTLRHRITADDISDNTHTSVAFAG